MVITSKIPVFGNLRQEDPMFEDSPGYRVRFNNNKKNINKTRDII